MMELSWVIRRVGFSAFLLLLALLTACASRPPQPSAEEAAASQPPPVVAPPREREASKPPTVRTVPVPQAARSLAAQAEQASQADDHERAAAYLERALRIAPNHPALWQNLAVVRYRQGDYAKVEGLAHKSNTLAAADPALRAENWRLIAEVRRQRGDRQGMDAALAEARRLAAISGAQ